MYDLNKAAGVLVKTTLVDFPGNVAAAFFLKGCNLRCPYCYNTDLVLTSQNKNQNENLISVNELFSHLEKRRSVLSGLAISGGEPLINPLLPTIIKKAKSLGYKIKLDTNGVLPDILHKFMSDKELEPDFIAMDIKTSPERYACELTADKRSDLTSFFVENLKKSINLLSELPASRREFRTVLVPGLVEKKDIENIAKILPRDASWQFANFRTGGCLDHKFNEISPYLEKQTKELVDYAKTFIPESNLR